MKVSRDMLMLLPFCVGVVVFARHIMIRINFYCFLIYFYLSVVAGINVSALPRLSKCQQSSLSKVCNYQMTSIGLFFKHSVCVAVIYPLRGVLMNHFKLCCRRLANQNVFQVICECWIYEKTNCKTHKVFVFPHSWIHTLHIYLYLPIYINDVYQTLCQWNLYCDFGLYK